MIIAAVVESVAIQAELIVEQNFHLCVRVTYSINTTSTSESDVVSMYV